MLFGSSSFQKEILPLMTCPWKNSGHQNLKTVESLIAKKKKKNRKVNGHCDHTGDSFISYEWNSFIQEFHLLRDESLVKKKDPYTSYTSFSTYMRQVL